MAKEIEKKANEVIFILKKIEILLKNQAGVEAPGREKLKQELSKLEAEREEQKKDE